VFQHSQEPITAEEKSRLEKPARCLLFWRKPERHDEQQQVVDVYQVSVEKCFVPPDFNEELPLYVLDVGGRYWCFLASGFLIRTCSRSPKTSSKRGNTTQRFSKLLVTVPRRTRAGLPPGAEGRRVCASRTIAACAKI